MKNLSEMQETGFYPGLGRSSAEGNGYLLQYSCLENSMDRGAWQVTVHGVTKSQTQLSNYHFHFQTLSRTSEAVLLVKNPPVNAGDKGDPGLISGSGSFSEGGHGNPPQYSCPENPMDRGA